MERREFYPLRRRAGLPRVRFHDLRHTAATLLLEEGINPKVVSERLGLAQVAITLDIYSHVTPHMQRQAADAMEVELGGGEVTRLASTTGEMKGALTAGQQRTR